MPRFRTSEPSREATPRQGTARHAAHARPEPSSALKPIASTEPVTTQSATVVPSSEEALEAGAPRPIDGVEVVATDAFDTLSAGSGALMGRQSAAGASEARGTGVLENVSSQRMDDRHRPSYRSSQRQVKVSRGPVIAIIIVAACVLVAAIVLIANAISAQRAMPSVQDADRLEETEVQPNEIILYDGYNYLVTQNEGGGWNFVRSSSTGSDPLVIFEFPGTPVCLILYDGAFIIPENLDGTWNAIAWTMGDGSVPTLLARQDGSTVEGQGQLTGAQLDGSKIVFTLADGSTQEVELF